MSFKKLGLTSLDVHISCYPSIYRDNTTVALVWKDIGRPCRSLVYKQMYFRNVIRFIYLYEFEKVTYALRRRPPFRFEKCRLGEYALPNGNLLSDTEVIRKGVYVSGQLAQVFVLSVYRQIGRKESVSVKGGVTPKEYLAQEEVRCCRVGSL